MISRRKPRERPSSGHDASPGSSQHTSLRSWDTCSHSMRSLPWWGEVTMILSSIFNFYTLLCFLQIHTSYIFFSYISVWLLQVKKQKKKNFSLSLHLCIIGMTCGEEASEAWHVPGLSEAALSDTAIKSCHLRPALLLPIWHASQMRGWSGGEDGWEGDNNITICLSDWLHHSPVSEAALGPAMTD